METIEELQAQIAVLQEAAKHVRIHHADEMAGLRARSTRAITEAVGGLQDSLVALSRGHHKMHIVKVLVTDAIHDLTDHMEKLAPQPRPKKQMEVDFSHETGKSMFSNAEFKQMNDEANEWWNKR